MDLLIYRHCGYIVILTLDWNEKAKVRKLLKKEEYEHILGELNKFPRELNHLIKFTNEKLTI